MQLNQVRRVKTGLKLNLEKVNPPSEFTRDYRVDVALILVEQLKPYALQARKIFDEEEITQLADTIKTHGIRSPLTVMKSDLEESSFEIISGERRWRAAKFLGMERVPCIIIDDKIKAQEIALIENIQRKDLNTIELLEGVESYINNNLTLSREETIKKLSMSKANFYRILNLTSLTSEVRQFVLNNPMSLEKLTYIAKASPERQFSLISDEEGNIASNNTKKSVGEVLDRVMNKKVKIIEMKIKGDQIESDTNFYILSKSNKTNIVTILRSFIAELEEEGR